MAKKAKTKASKPVGRPTKYRPEYCDLIIEHFDIPFYKTVIEQKMSASGAVKELEVQKPNDFPTLEGFARKLRVDPDTILNWSRKHPDFFGAIKICKGIQKDFLKTHGLNGGYVSSFAKFIAVNVTDLVDKSEVKTENEHNVKGYGLAFDLSEKPE